MNAKGAYLASANGYGWIEKGPTILRELLELAVDKFPESIPKMPEAIAFTGSSGAAIAFPLAMRYSLPLIMIRKDGDQCHGKSLECNYQGRISNFMIVDDFICTGATIRRILAKIAIRTRKRKERPPECIGIYQWDSFVGPDAGVRSFGRQTIPLYCPKVDDEWCAPEQLNLDLFGVWP